MNLKFKSEDQLVETYLQELPDMKLIELAAQGQGANEDKTKGRNQSSYCKQLEKIPV